MYTINSGTLTATAESPKRHSTEFALSYMRVSIIQDCIAACEDLAEELGADVQSDPLQQQLSECVSICELYLGANVRESRYRVRFALLCAEICTETMSACKAVRSNASRNCQVLCCACVKLIENDFQAVLSN